MSCINGKNLVVVTLAVIAATALSGAWWAGPCPDGSPQGYSIVTITRDEVKTTYQALGTIKQQVQESAVNE